MNIDIDFEVFKALTALRQSETHTYNQVIRELLRLDAATSPTGATVSKAAREDEDKRSFHSRDLTLPHGTQLRAVYKGNTYWAKIEDGRWVDLTGIEHKSPSAAARDITHNNVNGLRFWQAKRPADTDWCTLELLALIG